MILGPVGNNFVAGFTGGIAFVYDEANDFELRVNPDTITWHRVTETYWAHHLLDLINEHATETQSRFAEMLLNAWDRSLPRFWIVVPRDYARFLPVPVAAPDDLRIPAQ